MVGASRCGSTGPGPAAGGAGQLFPPLAPDQLGSPRLSCGPTPSKFETGKALFLESPLSACGPPASRRSRGGFGPFAALANHDIVRQVGWGCRVIGDGADLVARDRVPWRSLIPPVKSRLGRSLPPGEGFSTGSARMAVPGWRSRTRTARSGVRGRTQGARRRARDRARSSPSSRRGRTGGGRTRADQAAAGSALQRNSVPSRQRRCRSTASLRATATLAFLKPLRWAMARPQLRRAEVRLILTSSTFAAS